MQNRGWPCKVDSAKSDITLSSTVLGTVAGHHCPANVIAPTLELTVWFTASAQSFLLLRVI